MNNYSLTLNTVSENGVDAEGRSAECEEGSSNSQGS